MAKGTNDPCVIWASTCKPSNTQALPLRPRLRYQMRKHTPITCLLGLGVGCSVSRAVEAMFSQPRPLPLLLLSPSRSQLKDVCAGFCCSSPA